MSGSGVGPTEVVRCSSCGRDVPEGEFCGACGAHLETGHGVLARRYRYHAFAANPAEHVLHPSVSSTLFPQLPHRRAVPFRLALLLAVGVLLVLSVLRWTGP